MLIYSYQADAQLARGASGRGHEHTRLLGSLLGHEKRVREDAPGIIGPGLIAAPCSGDAPRFLWPSFGGFWGPSGPTGVFGLEGSGLVRGRPTANRTTPKLQTEIGDGWGVSWAGLALGGLLLQGPVVGVLVFRSK